jgi:tagaturonate reductase
MSITELKSLPAIQSLPRKQYPIKVLQFGTGNFLRGFADWMIQQANVKLDLNMGVCAVQSVSTDDTLKNQAGLFTVIERGISNGKPVAGYERIEVIQKVVSIKNEYESYLREAENPALEIVISNTTESGIKFNPQDDLPTAPATTFPGNLTQFLWHRFKTLPGKPLLIIPCELLVENGKKLKECVLHYAAHWKLEQSFVLFVEKQVTFCNTLVDRIVPGFPPDEKALLNELGYKDELLTACEPYHLWAVEAPASVQEKFPLHKAGVNFIYTDNLEYYRARKVRILNGAHSIMATVGTLAGIETVKQAMDHEVIRNFISATIFKEIVPTLPGNPIDLAQYAKDVLDRFQNPYLVHSFTSISLEHLSKWRIRIIPTLQVHAATGKNPPQHLSLAIAALFCLYIREDLGNTIAWKDELRVIRDFQSLWKSLNQNADTYIKFTTAALSKSEWWESDLSYWLELRNQIAEYMKTIVQTGVVATIQALPTNTMR